MSDARLEFAWGRVADLDPSDPRRCRVLLDDGRDVRAWLPRLSDPRAALTAGATVRVIVHSDACIIVTLDPA
jgi:hypothetical protein